MAKPVNEAFGYAEIDIQELRFMLRTSHEAFMEFFLADEIDPDDGVQDFHLICFGRFVDILHPRDVAALPRDHAKTTYLRLAFNYLMWYSDLQFFVYMSATHGMACASLQVIWNTLNSDEAIEVFGRPVPSIVRISEGHLEFFLTWYDEQGVAHEKLVILKAQGAQQAVRGMNLHKMRPQYVGCDDIEDETAVKTKEGYEKFKAWFDNTFMRAVSRKKGKNKVAQIGNLIGLNTLLNDNLRDPDWRAMRLGILRRNGQPLWPGRFPLEDIKRDLEAAKRRGQLSAWFGELMNMPINLETALVDSDRIHYTARRHPADGAHYLKFITVDPAISKQDHADEAAIVLHTIDVMGVPQVTAYIHARGLGEDGMAEAIGQLCDEWDCSIVFVESVQLQKVLASYFALYFALQNVNHIQFLPLELPRTHKLGRLRVFAAALMTGDWTLAEGDWEVVNQMMNFDVRKDNNLDDLIDACSMGMTAQEKFSKEIAEAQVSAAARRDRKSITAQSSTSM